MLKEQNESLIRALARLLEETGLSEIELEQEGVRVRVGRGGSAVVVPSVSSGSPNSGTSPPAPMPSVSSASVGGDGSSDDLSNHPGIVTAPMVGTAYIASSPGGAPFIREGDMIKKGDPLLIIEAMKTMNQIVAQRDGRVKTILFRDNQPVEFGEPLLILE